MCGCGAGPVCALWAVEGHGGPWFRTAIRAALNRTGFGLLCIDIRKSIKLMWVFASGAQGCTLRYKLPQAVKLSGGWVRSRFEPLPISLRGRGSVGIQHTFKIHERYIGYVS